MKKEPSSVYSTEDMLLEKMPICLLLPPEAIILGCDAQTVLKGVAFEHLEMAKQMPQNLN
jgi:hypothetical protein